MTLSPRMAVLGLDLVEEVFGLGRLEAYGYVESGQNSTPSRQVTRLIYGLLLEHGNDYSMAPSVGGLTPQGVYVCWNS